MLKQQQRTTLEKDESDTARRRKASANVVSMRLHMVCTITASWREGKWKKKAHVDPVTSGGVLLFYHSACLCFDLFKSLFKGCVFLCLHAALALQGKPTKRACLASPETDLQSYCIKRIIFITTLHTALYHCTGNITLPQTQVLSHSELRKAF